MSLYLYLSLVPEALIYSQLSPERFGKYLSLGAKNSNQRPAFFFSVDPDFKSDSLKLEEAKKKCVEHPDGTPRRSTYAAVYAVLANIPLSVIGSLYLTTSDGKTLKIDGEDKREDEKDSRFYLYQELCPVEPKVASPLGPKAFCQLVTDPSKPIFLPRMVFCDMRLDDLAHSPEQGKADRLPYHNLSHLRECLVSMQYNKQKLTKIVNRDVDISRVFHVIEKAFYIGDQESFRHYPIPSKEQLETEYVSWYKSAMSMPRL